MRMCERIAGLSPQRRVAFTDEPEIAVFNPSPHPRSDIVRFNLDAYPPFAGQDEPRPIHPLIWANMRPGGWTVDGTSARLVENDVGKRVRVINEQRDWAVEFVARDVPAFGWKRFTLARTDGGSEDTVDDGREIAVDDIRIVANDDGTFDATMDGRTLRGLGWLEDTGDRGDTYDYDPVPGDWKIGDVRIERRRHSSGIAELHIERLFGVPLLTEDRSARSDRNRFLRLVQIVRVAPGTGRIDVDISIDNEAPDHRLRMLFPTGAPAETSESLTTLDITTRSTGPRDGSAWIHPAPTTFPIQGWVACNDLTVVAPGLNEAEVTPDGTIAITLLRCTGWLSRMDLKTRPSHAGPALPTPGAQCVRRTHCAISLIHRGDARSARDAELGLLATATGTTPLVPPGVPLLAIGPRHIVLSALKPADDGDGTIIRLLNPTGDDSTATIELGLDVTSAAATNLDETEADRPLALDGRTLRVDVPAHALRTVRLR
jgi:hypothetical protein